MAKKVPPNKSFPENENLISEFNSPIIRIGTSARGLGNFEAIVPGLPAEIDPDMAFAVVKDLAPGCKSIPTVQLQRHSRMQSFEVRNGMPAQTNCSGIIPSNQDMPFLNRTIQLSQPSAPRKQHLPVNFFFPSLCYNHQKQAIAIMHSGTGKDGNLENGDNKGNGRIITPHKTDRGDFAIYLAFLKMNIKLNHAKNAIIIKRKKGRILAWNTAA